MCCDWKLLVEETPMPGYATAPELLAASSWNCIESFDKGAKALTGLIFLLEMICCVLGCLKVCGCCYIIVDYFSVDICEIFDRKAPQRDNMLSVCDLWK